jgi:hypothetical protein
VLSYVPFALIAGLDGKKLFHLRGKVRPAFIVENFFGTHIKA